MKHNRRAEGWLDTVEIGALYGAFGDGDGNGSGALSSLAHLAPSPSKPPPPKPPTTLKASPAKRHGLRL